jgi:hypothetical protein
MRIDPMLVTELGTKEVMFARSRYGAHSTYDPVMFVAWYVIVCPL